MDKPLALKLAPTSLKEVIGQKHLVGDNMILSNLVKNKKLFSMILYGKPGIGKTSIANAIINDLGVRHRFLNATVNSKKDLDIVIEEAKMYDGIVLVMDEIHRLNKDKQDILLPCLESGLITLIGMTTSNPYHSINPAIRSRCQLFELKDLETSDIVEGLKKAVSSPYLPNIKIDDDTINYIARASGNDLRYAYNLLEISYYSTNDFKVDIDVVKKINSKPVFNADKNGDGYYDMLSAFQKSIRGSDVDASLHYLARLITIGDLDSIFRRMSVIAYEDIGLANPSIGPKVMAAIDAAKLVGLPEARIPLGTIVTEMALSPKSNTAHIALDEALSDIEKGNVGDIPKHLKNPSDTYKYPHDYKNAFVKQQYLPDKLKNKKYYHPKDLGYEHKLKEIYLYLEKQKKEN
ncbi:MAG TPA: replication-associated recombination protein A [Candidatus Onthousia excrementipullorum]|uniref:Replication-associated recombination protein A n=1 Tax=Candidatus Onthousia excrementipullorum TaxID=2840884 RepID=A0A9D1DUB8_9FIRM|nr:replication-associated recombination protein A [Candidatus Onthousia excrementipullorum]